MSAPCPRFGFIVDTAPTQDVTALRRALAERLAAAGLELQAESGGTSTIVITREGSQATESDRQFVIDLLDRELNAGAATVSDLVDLSY